MTVDFRVYTKVFLHFHFRSNENETWLAVRNQPAYRRAKHWKGRARNETFLLFATIAAFLRQHVTVLFQLVLHCFHGSDPRAILVFLQNQSNYCVCLFFAIVCTSTLPCLQLQRCESHLYETKNCVASLSASYMSFDCFFTAL